MANAGSCYLAGLVVPEYELWDSSTAARCKRPLEEVLTILRKGALLLKHGRQGKPKVHFFRLTSSDTVLRWKSASGSVRQVKLRTVAEVVSGQTTEVFKRYMLREADLSFSLKYTDDDGSHRTLDLTCYDRQQYEAWYTGLRVVADRLRVTGTPAIPAAAAYAAQFSGGSFSSSILSSTDLARCYGGGTAVGRASGAMGIPVVEHVPGDLLAWGAASRVPQAASTRSAPDAETWQRSKVPVPLQCNTSLDVCCAAVGRLHGVLVTSSGTVYTWGEGKGGKLGLGHDQDHATPHKLEHGLGGQCVAAVACGDDCTAAITEAGALYMWGRLASASTPQLVPVPVRGELNNHCIIKVSCGPFHCAAVSMDGALFTWGEGFGGKLGHGDQISKAQPALVRTLLGRQVLGVACGVWHTAAIVVETDGPLARAASQALGLGSPAKAEQSAPELTGVEGLALPGGHHRRNSSASSAFSDASFFHEGQGGTLYTWGGVNDSVLYGGNEKRDSNKGCLGHGDVDVLAGQLLPTRVGAALEGKAVRQVAAGLHLTVAVTTGGRVFQMGCTGVSGGKHCPWEGAASPELVKGALAGYFVDSVSCGMHHTLALARPLDRKQGRPVENSATVVFAWGKGSEGQLGNGRFDDSASPLVVDSLKGRLVTQVACGGCNTMVVCQHDMRRFEPDTKEAEEAAITAFYGMMDAKPPKQLRIQMPEGYAATPRARSILQPGSSTAIVLHAQSGALARPASASSKMLGGGGRAPTISEMYATLRSAQRQTLQAQRGGGGGKRLPHARTDPMPHAPAAAGTGGGGAPRVLGVPSTRRPMGVSSSMPSLSGISHAHSWGGASELSSVSSLRQASEDWSVGGDSRTGGATHASMDLAAIDEAGSISSLNEELHEKNRVIEHLESKLQQLRRQTSRASSGDSEERLRQSVRASAGQFRESFHAGDWNGSGRSGRPSSLSRPSMSVSEAGTSVHGEEEREANLRAMEQMLVKKQVHLESQQHKLAQWAMELQRREIELQRRQAEAEGRPFTDPSFPSAQSALAGFGVAGSSSSLTADGAVPPAPIASESPVLLRRHRCSDAAAPAGAAGIRTAPAAVPASTEGSMGAGGAGPSGNGWDQSARMPVRNVRPDAGGMGMPGAPPGAPGTTEWMEEIETGVFVTYTTDGGLQKLKRIRFSRNVFSKESAAKWYETNKHRLAQPIGTPKVAGRYASTPPSTAPPALPPGEAPGLAGSLGSRNLSFDPSELAALQQAPSAVGSAGAVGPTSSKPPSRLSQVSRPFTAPSDNLRGREAAAAGGVGARGGPSSAAMPPNGSAAQQQTAGEDARLPPVSPFALPQATQALGAGAGLPAVPPSPLSGASSEGASPNALSQNPHQLSQLPSEVLLSVTTLLSVATMEGGGGGGEGAGCGRSSPSKRSSHHHSLLHQGSLGGRGSTLARDLSRSSLSSGKSEVSRGSAQFSPRFAAPSQAALHLERKPSPQAAAISAAAGAAGLPAAQGLSTERRAPSPSPSAPAAAQGDRVASPGAPLALSPAGSGLVPDVVRSPSRMSRIKAALKPSSKKKERAGRAAERAAA